MVCSSTRSGDDCCRTMLTGGRLSPERNGVRDTAATWYGST